MDALTVFALVCDGIAVVFLTITGVILHRAERSLRDARRNLDEGWRHIAEANALRERQRRDDFDAREREFVEGTFGYQLGRLRDDAERADDRDLLGWLDDFDAAVRRDREDRLRRHLD